MSSCVEFDVGRDQVMCWRFTNREKETRTVMGQEEMEQQGKGARLRDRERMMGMEAGWNGAKREKRDRERDRERETEGIKEKGTVEALSATAREQIRNRPIFILPEE